MIYIVLGSIVIQKTKFGLCFYRENFKTWVMEIKEGQRKRTVINGNGATSISISISIEPCCFKI